MSATKTPAADHDTNEHYLRIDSLTIEPPLSSAVTKALVNDHVLVKENKNEDVVWNDATQSIEVVSNNVTEVTAKRAPNDYSYEYSEMKKAVKAIAKASKDAGAKMNGSVIVRHADDGRVFRLLIRDNVVSIEGAVMAFPDGTTITLVNNTLEV